MEPLSHLTDNVDWNGAHEDDRGDGDDDDCDDDDDDYGGCGMVW